MNVYVPGLCMFVPPITSRSQYRMVHVPVCIYTKTFLELLVLVLQYATVLLYDSHTVPVQVVLCIDRSRFEEIGRPTAGISMTDFVMRRVQ